MSERNNPFQRFLNGLETTVETGLKRPTLTSPMLSHSVFCISSVYSRILPIPITRKAKHHHASFEQYHTDTFLELLE